MPIMGFDSDATYRALTEGRRAMSSFAGSNYIQLRSQVIELLPKNWSDVYSHLIGLYDMVMKQKWPEDPAEDAEFVQLCSFLMLIEDHALLRAQHKTIKIAVTEQYKANTELINENAKLRGLILTLKNRLSERAQIHRPIMIDDWTMNPMTPSGEELFPLADLTQPAPSKDAQDALKQYLQDVAGLSGSASAGIVGQASATNISNTGLPYFPGNAWQHMSATDILRQINKMMQQQQQSQQAINQKKGRKP